MNTYKIENELKAYIVDSIADLKETPLDELHHNLFNTDYYIIGYYNASQKLKEWDIDAFACIEYVQGYETSNFGETNIKINSEAIVNMLAYIIGEEILYSLSSVDFEDVEITDEHIELIIEELED